MFAADFVCAFENRDEAEAFMGWLPERLGKFKLELAGEKTGLVRFSREAMERNGGFRFLGFLYHWTLSCNGRPKVQRMTDPDKLRKSVTAFTEWIKGARHCRARRLMGQLKLNGYWNYSGVTGNGPSPNKFRWHCVRLLHKWLTGSFRAASFRKNFPDMPPLVPCWSVKPLYPAKALNELAVTRSTTFPGTPGRLTEMRREIVP